MRAPDATTLASCQVKSSRGGYRAGISVGNRITPSTAWRSPGISGGRHHGLRATNRISRPSHSTTLMGHTSSPASRRPLTPFQTGRNLWESKAGRSRAPSGVAAVPNSPAGKVYLTSTYLYSGTFDLGIYGATNGDHRHGTNMRLERILLLVGLGYKMHGRRKRHQRGQLHVCPQQPFPRQSLHWPITSGGIVA